MTTPHPHDPDSAAQRVETRHDREGPDPVTDASTRPTRRGFLRTFGAGALALGTVGAVPGAGAQSSEPRIEGIDDWTLTEERIASDEVGAGPTVRYEDDAVVVTGSTTFSDGCGTFRVGRLVYSEERSRLGVVIDSGRTDTSEVCTEAMEPTRFELRVTASDFVQETVVDEAFTDAEPSVHPRNDHVGGIGELPPEISDYEFQWGSDLEDAPDVGPSQARSVEPTVTFDGSDVVVEGVVVYGSSSCNEVALTSLSRHYDVEGHVGVDVEARRRPTSMPGGPCTTDVAVAPYRLRLIGSGDPSLDRCSVRESGVEGNHDVTVEEVDGELELPGAMDHRLVIDRSVSYDDRQAAVESPPSVSVESGDVVVEGTMVVGSSSCHTLHLGSVAYGGGDGANAPAELEVDLEATERRADLEGCTADVVTADYRLELVVDSLPDVVTASEHPRGEDDPVRQTSVDLDGSDDAPELPPGVVDSSVSLEQDASSDAVESPPSVVASTPMGTADPQVHVEGALRVGGCESFELVDVRWEDDEQSHLAATVGPQPEEPYTDLEGSCPLDVAPSPTAYTVDLVVESLPAFVTVEEVPGDADTSVYSVTEGIGACPDSRSVEGQSVCDLDGDGLFMDVTGDGGVDNVDVVEFFQVQHREAWKRPELFDFSGNDAVGHGDVVALFEHAASSGV